MECAATTPPEPPSGKTFARRKFQGPARRPLSMCERWIMVPRALWVCGRLQRPASDAFTRNRDPRGKA